MRSRSNICVAALLGALAVALPLHAKTLRWASQGDVLTFDPYAQNESFNNTFNSYVYESLVQYDKKFDVVPQLATKWEQVSPTQWRFHLRPNVHFQEGEPFTADDVVFSINRQNSKRSMTKAYLAGVAEAKKVDDLTVDIMTSGPAPVLLRQLTDVRIMSKAWCEKHNVVEVQDYLAKEETYAVGHANGTGPYILKSREPDVKTVLEANPKWWGKMEGNVTEIVYTPIKSAATRTAALLSGEIDFTIAAENSLLPHYKSGKLRPIAIAASTRAAILPDIPTIAEAGPLPGYAVNVWLGVMAPAGTPRPIVDRLNAEINKVVRDPQIVKERMNTVGLEPVGSTPEQLLETMKTELAKYTKLARDANIQPE